MCLGSFDSRIKFPRKLLLVSFISFSVDSLNECLYRKSDRPLKKIITSLHHQNHLLVCNLSAVCFGGFTCLIHKSKKSLNKSESIDKGKSATSQSKHYIVAGKLACSMSKILILRKLQIKVSNCCNKNS